MFCLSGTRCSILCLLLEKGICFYGWEFFVLLSDIHKYYYFSYSGTSKSTIQLS